VVRRLVSFSLQSREWLKRSGAGSLGESEQRSMTLPNPRFGIADTASGIHTRGFKTIQAIIPMIAIDEKTRL